MSFENSGVLEADILVVARKQEERNIMQEECRKIIEEMVKATYGKKVIELGVTQNFLPFLEAKFGDKTFRMDISDWIERNNKVRNGDVQGNLLGLPIAADSVDVVVSIHVFEDAEELKSTLDEVQRMLITGGTALITVHENLLDENDVSERTGLCVCEKRAFAPDMTTPSRIVVLRKE